jgi:hypothetical protein
MGILGRGALCLGQEPVDWSSSFRGKDVMANDDKPLKGRAGETARGKFKPPTERPFDMWLQKQLHAMYDEITAEPLPDDLLNLIDRDATKGPTPEPGKKK